MGRLDEELAMADVRSMVDGKLEAFVKSSEFKKAVRSIAADAMEKYFRIMYNKRGLWRAEVANG